MNSSNERRAPALSGQRSALPTSSTAPSPPAGDADRRATNPLALHRALRKRLPVFDRHFDTLYPPAIRGVSSQFWTPVSVAVRASELLVRNRKTRVLDVGAGVGKFCLVGAAVTGAAFVGLEHREHFVEMANDAARRLRVRTASFVHARLDKFSADDFDAYYFYNPFEENLWNDGTQLDRTVELSERRFFADVEIAMSMLARARTGTLVATYHGFGGVMPSGYQRVLREPCWSDHIELWVKEARGEPVSRTDR